LEAECYVGGLTLPLAAIPGAALSNVTSGLYHVGWYVKVAPQSREIAACRIHA